VFVFLKLPPAACTIPWGINGGRAKFGALPVRISSPRKADFQSSHEAPRSSLRVMHEHFHPITMLNSSF
jgi:hypothetical protein